MLYKPIKTGVMLLIQSLFAEGGIMKKTNKTKESIVTIR